MKFTLDFFGYWHVNLDSWEYVLTAAPSQPLAGMPANCYLPPWQIAYLDSNAAQ
jgi:hypothetical protein